jgi:flagellar motor component MotA
MARYSVSLVAFVIAAVCSIFMTGITTIWAFLDIPSLIITVLFPFLFAGILFGFNETGAAFSTALKKEGEKDKLIQALDFFKTYGKATWLAALISVLIGVVSMLVNLEDKMMLGPCLALALVSLLYSGIINLVIIIPFTLFIKKQLKV